MSDDNELSIDELIAEEEELLLPAGESLEFDVDSYKVKENRKGRKYLVLTLVVVEGAHEGKVATQNINWPESAAAPGYSMFKKNLRAFGLDRSILSENGVKQSKDLGRLGEAIVNAPVKGYTTHGEFQGEVQVGAFLNRSERLDVDKHIQW